MYALGDPFPAVTVEPGTNVLLTGPSMVGKSEVWRTLVANGLRTGEGGLVVTTNDDEGTVRADLAERVEGSPPAAGVETDLPLGVVDAVSGQTEGVTSDRSLVRHAASPTDLTGIGIGLSELLRTLSERGFDRNRVVMDSVSTLLLYSDLETVFRFLHVFTARLDDADTLGVFVMDEGAHDQQTTSAVTQLFDGVLELEPPEEGASDSRRARFRGLDGVDADWRAV